MINNKWPGCGSNKSWLDWLFHSCEWCCQRVSENLGKVCTVKWQALGKRAVPSSPYICISSFCCLLPLQPGQILSRSRKIFFCLFLKISTRTMAITSLSLQRTELVRAWSWSTTGCRARHQGTWQGGHHYDDDHHRPQGAGQGGQEGDGELAPRAWQAHQDRAKEEAVAWL